MIFSQEFILPPPSLDEIARYIGGFSESLESTVKSCLDEYSEKAAFSYKVCYCILPLKTENRNVDFSLFSVRSAALAKNLAGCERAVVFAATAGIEIDRLITKYSKTSPSKALIFQGIGAERIECLCDKFCEKLRESYEICPRFSPGYGDLDIALQKDIFRVLDCGRKIGLYLNESLLMSPTKSVTAIVGLKSGKEQNK